MATHWNAVEQYFTVVLFVFQFYPVFNFGNFLNVGLDTVRSERVKETTTLHDLQFNSLSEKGIKESCFNKTR